MSPRFQFVPYNNRPSKEDDSVCDFQLLVAFHCDCVRNFEKRQGTGIMQWSSTVKGRIFHAERQVTLYVMIHCSRSLLVTCGFPWNLAVKYFNCFAIL